MLIRKKHTDFYECELQNNELAGIIAKIKVPNVWFDSEKDHFKIKRAMRVAVIRAKREAFH